MFCVVVCVCAWGYVAKDVLIFFFFITDSMILCVYVSKLASAMATVCASTSQYVPNARLTQQVSPVYDACRNIATQQELCDFLYKHYGNVSAETCL